MDVKQEENKCPYIPPLFPPDQMTPEWTWAQIDGEDRWFANLTVVSLNLSVINLRSHGTYYSNLDDAIDRPEKTHLIFSLGATPRLNS